MKTLWRNAKGIVVILLSLFVITMVYLVYTFTVYGDRWMNSPYNTRLQDMKSEVIPGDILDRDGSILATADAEGNRVYPSDAALRWSVAHLVGDTQGYLPGGVDMLQSDTLLGFRQSLWERIAALFSGKTRKGDSLEVTCDAELQKYIYEVFPEGKSGAVVVMNYKTGEILGMCSFPSFDLNNISEYTAEGSALVNRVTQGQYAPGSIFKIVTLSAALDRIQGIQNETFDCDGEAAYGEGLLTDAGHGNGLTLKKAFAKSCNLTYGSLAVRMGASALQKEASAFRFNDDFLFDGLIVYPSVLKTGSMDDFTLAWTGVGQGETVVTPLHMAMIAGAIGNDGSMMQPYILQSRLSIAGGQSKLGVSTVYARVTSADRASIIGDYMRAVVEEGTGRRAAIDGLTVCGKTGSAQVASSGSGAAAHAWFVGYLDEDDYPYSIAVIVENGDSGGEIAAPIAGKVLQKAVKVV